MRLFQKPMGLHRVPEDIGPAIKQARMLGACLCLDDQPYPYSDYAGASRQFVFAYEKPGSAVRSVFQ